MSTESDHDLLTTLRHMRDRIELDSSAGMPTLEQRYGLLPCRIVTTESSQTINQGGGDRVF